MRVTVRPPGSRRGKTHTPSAVTSGNSTSPLDGGSGGAAAIACRTRSTICCGVIWSSAPCCSASVSDPCGAVSTRVRDGVSVAPAPPSSRSTTCSTDSPGPRVFGSKLSPVCRQLGAHDVVERGAIIVIAEPQRCRGGSREDRGDRHRGHRRGIDRDPRIGIVAQLRRADDRVEGEEGAACCGWDGSSAVNDPSTAISCVDQLSRIIIHWTHRTPPPSHYYAPPHVLRLVVPWMSFDGLLDTAFEQIRHYAVADVAVSLRLMRAYSDIAGSTPHADLRASLLERARRVAAGCAGHLPKDELVKLKERLAAIEASLATAN